MKDLKKMAEKAKSLLAQMEAAQKKIEELKGKKDEEGAKLALEQFNKLKDEFDGLKVDMEEAKAHAKRVAMAQEIETMAADAPGAPSGTPAAPPKVPAKTEDLMGKEIRRRDVFFKYVRSKPAELNLSGEEAELISPQSKAILAGEGKNSVSIPKSLLAKIMGLSWAMKMGLFEGENGKTIYSVANPASGLNPSAGQNLTYPEFVPQLQQLPTPKPTIMDFVTMMPMEAGSLVFPVLVQTDANEFGGIVFQWLGEGAEKPETEPEFSQCEIVGYEVAGYTEVSERMLSRSRIALEAFLTRILREAMRYLLDTVILNGTGAAQPQGIVGTAGIRTVARAAANAVAYEDLVRLKHAILPHHRAGSIFLLHDDVELYLELTTDTQGRPLFNASVANGPYDRLVGYPYGVGLNLPGLGSSGDVIFGDPSQYILGMENEITIARSTEYRFRNNLVAFKIFAVIGGRLCLPRAMVILDAATS